MLDVHESYEDSKGGGGSVPLTNWFLNMRAEITIVLKKNPQRPKTYVVPVKSLPLVTTREHIIVSNAVLTQSQQQKKRMYLRWGRPNLMTTKNN